MDVVNHQENVTGIQAKKHIQHLLSLACLIIVGVLTVAVFPNSLAVVLLSSKLGVNVRVHELIHVNDIVRTVRASSRSRATASWAKLEVNKTLLIQTIEILSVIIVFVVIVAEVATVVLVRRGALLEPDGVAGDPAEVVVIVVVVVEQTSGGEDAVA